MSLFTRLLWWLIDRIDGRKLLAALLLVCGCTHAEYVWRKPGAGAREWRTDYYECHRDARSTYAAGRGVFTRVETSVDKDMFLECLYARDWSPVLVRK